MAKTGHFSHSQTDLCMQLKKKKQKGNTQFDKSSFQNSELKGTEVLLGGACIFSHYAFEM